MTRSGESAPNWFRGGENYDFPRRIAAIGFEYEIWDNLNKKKIPPDVFKLELFVKPNKRPEDLFSFFFNSLIIHS